jgi:hypothetical protein
MKFNFYLYTLCILTFNTSVTCASKRHQIIEPENETVEIHKLFDQKTILMVQKAISPATFKKLDAGDKAALLGFGQMLQGIFTMAATKDSVDNKQIFEQALQSTFLGFSQIVSAGFKHIKTKNKKIQSKVIDHLTHGYITRLQKYMHQIFIFYTKQFQLNITEI